MQITVGTQSDPIVLLATRQSIAIFALLFLLCLTGLSVPVFAQSLELQRKDYLAAKKALHAKQYKTFDKIAHTLKDYPLYPYLRYEYLRKRLWKMKNEAVVTFLKQYNDLPVTDSLRTSWLKLLAKRGHWDTFLDNYTPQATAIMQCYQLQARMKTHNKTLLLEDIRSLWLTGKSLPPQCDTAFALLYQSDLMTNDLVWARIRLSMQNNEINLARYLASRLDPAHKTLAKKWVQIHRNPYKYTHKPTFKDTPVGREILVHGILRLTKISVTKAVKRLDALKKRYAFTPAAMAQMERTLALRAAIKKHPLAAQLLDKIDNQHVNEKVFQYRLRTALAHHDWPLLRKWTTGPAPVADFAMRWQYWQARALEAMGMPDQANTIYAALAKERDYYGFLAADKLNVPYAMNHYPLPENKKEWVRIESLPAIKRTYEFYKLDMHGSATREWTHALNKMTTYQMQIAAAIAAQWGWHSRAIFTMGRAKAYDDLVLRFPVLFNDLLDKYAQKHNIDAGWIYGLVRAESAFVENIQSPAGALGLMQVMPATGRDTAKRIGLKGFKAHKLKRAEINIPIGSAYMKQMLDRFNSHITLATAAYNAGPNRVVKWLPQRGCEQSDIWVEQIPFDETRKYVRRVLAFANVYDWRLNRAIKPITARMPYVTSNKNNAVANPGCAAIKIADKKHVN